MVKKVIILGRKAGAANALKWLVENGINIPFVVADKKESGPEHLAAISETLGIPVYFDDAPIYEMISREDPGLINIDLVISYLYPKKIKEPLYKLGRRGCVNFHPAPLPDYKSRAGYNTAILHQRENFGVSAHFIDSERFDSGPIIKVLTFPIDHNNETALSLESKAQEKLFELFIQTMELFLNGQEIETTDNVGGLYLTAVELEKMKVIDLANDPPEEINRKIRAFFFPPYHGAKITIGGHEYTLINEQILKYLARLIQKTK